MIVSSPARATGILNQSTSLGVQMKPVVAVPLRTSEVPLSDELFGSLGSAHGPLFALFTVTRRSGLVPIRLEPLYALAVSERWPLSAVAVFHDQENGVAESVTCLMPSRYTALGHRWRFWEEWNRMG